MPCRNYTPRLDKIWEGSTPQFDVWRARIDFFDSYYPQTWLSNASTIKADVELWLEKAKAALDSGMTEPPQSPIGATVVPEGSTWSYPGVACKGSALGEWENYLIIGAAAGVGAVASRKQPALGMLVGAAVGAVALVVMGKLTIPGLTLPSPATSTAIAVQWPANSTAWSLDGSVNSMYALNPPQSLAEYKASAGYA